MSEFNGQHLMYDYGFTHSRVGAPFLMAYADALNEFVSLGPIPGRTRAWQFFEGYFGVIPHERILELLDANSPSHRFLASIPSFDPAVRHEMYTCMGGGDTVHEWMDRLNPTPRPVGELPKVSPLRVVVSKFRADARNYRHPASFRRRKLFQHYDAWENVARSIASSYELEPASQDLIVFLTYAVDTAKRNRMLELHRAMKTDELFWRQIQSVMLQRLTWRDVRFWVLRYPKLRRRLRLELQSLFNEEAKVRQLVAEQTLHWSETFANQLAPGDKITP
jgi:hypothetical protein